MNTYLKICLIAIVSCLCGIRSVAQENVKKKVALYVTGEDIDNAKIKVISARLGTAITSSNTFALVETNAEFIAQLEKEVGRQIGGNVRDNQIVKLGQQYGVKYVVVATVSEAWDEYFIAARLINVETALVEKAFDAYGSAETIQQIVKLTQDVANGLLQGVAGPAGGNIYSANSGSGGNVETFTVNGVSFEMVKVEGGSFQMGGYQYNSEQPVHTETVSTFYIGKTEVTQALWVAVMGNNPSKFRGETNPVEMVSWYDCQEFVDRLSRLTGRIFRLPTEAEWEYAARGGNRSRNYTYSGSNDLYRVGWYDENSGQRTHPVAQKLDNELGIFDMSGNVWEWCSDQWSDNYSSPRNSSYRVLRGGSWDSSATYCRVARRCYYSPGGRYNLNGLRLAL